MQRIQPEAIYFNLHKADFIGLNNYIDQVDWLGLMSVNLVPNDIWAAYTNVIRDGVDLFVPSVIAMLGRTIRLKLRLTCTQIIYAKQLLANSSSTATIQVMH